MRLRAAILIIAALCLRATAAELPSWRTDLAEARKDALVSGRPVLVFAVLDDTVIRSLDRDKAFVESARLALLVRVAPANALFATLIGDGNSVPEAALFSPEGILVESYAAAPAAAALASDIRAARARWLIAAAAAASAGGDDVSAIRYLTEAQGITPPHDVVLSVRKAVDEISARCRAGVREADALVAEARWSEARAAYEKLVVTYAGTDAGLEASRRLEEMTRNPRIAEGLARDAYEAEARKLLELADAAEQKGRFSEAAGLFRKVSRDYSRSSLASDAAAGFTRTYARAAEEDRAAQKKMEDDCRSWLSVADAYAGAGRYEKAMAGYQRVIDAYPKTGFADIARERMKKLKKPPSA